MSDSVGESGHDIAPVRDGETAMRQCPSCKTETTMRYRIKSSWFGLKKTEFWGLHEMRKHPRRSVKPVRERFVYPFNP